MIHKIHNFSAGPGILPDEVLQKAAEACINFKNSNLSLLEISHRSKDWVEVMDEIQIMVKRILNLPERYSVLFLQGGASLQFAMVPFNLMNQNGSAAYVNTGVWAKKAFQEAKKLGNASVIASSEDKNYNYIPKNYSIPENADYLHITSNNTIYGTQIKDFPYNSPVPLVCDMSSDMFSREIDASKFSLIYAGAQKNMGPAGSTMVIVDQNILGKSERNIRRPTADSSGVSDRVRCELLADRHCRRCLRPSERPPGRVRPPNMGAWRNRRCGFRRLAHHPTPRLAVR